jgi:hypothetical protein
VFPALGRSSPRARPALALVAPSLPSSPSPLLPRSSPASWLALIAPRSPSSPPRSHPAPRPRALCPAPALVLVAPPFPRARPPHLRHPYPLTVKTPRSAHSEFLRPRTRGCVNVRVLRTAVWARAALRNGRRLRNAARLLITSRPRCTPLAPSMRGLPRPSADP